MKMRTKDFFLIEGKCKVAFDVFGLDNWVTLHCRKSLVKKGALDVFVNESTYKEVVRDNNSLFGTIYDIDGVVSVYFGQYTIGIHKAELFSWDEILPKVKALLEPYLAD